MKVLLTLLFGLWLLSPLSAQSTYYVATTGSDASGNGSSANPWATITHALDNAVNGSTILVKPGLYTGRVRVRGSFNSGVAVRSEIPYQAKLRNNDRVLTFYDDPAGCHGITFDGFDIAHDGAGAAALVVHIEGNGTGAVHDITIQNCILHDSYNNDIAKINHACYNITIRGNLFYNQTGSDEHIDGNSVRNLVIEDNIFMNDFAASGRTNTNSTSSYIVLKDSDNTDIYTGAQQIKVRRNIFLNYEGGVGTNFLLLGEDGNPYYEAWDVMIENNLMLGNSNNTMRAPFGLKGAKQVTFRNNTIVGDLPSNAFAFRFNVEINNPNNDSIYIYNNIWSDPTGTMGDFSDTPIGETILFQLDRNLYWNDGNAIPADLVNDLININDDARALQGNPQLGSQSGLIPPHFNGITFVFADGSTSIRQAFEQLVNNYGALPVGSIAIDSADASLSPSNDILGNPRGTVPDLGAFEFGTATPLRLTANSTTLKMFPNPSIGTLQIEWQSDFMGNCMLEITDIKGQTLQSKSISKTTAELVLEWDVNDLPQGAYLLRLKAGAKEWTRLWRKQ